MTRQRTGRVALLAASIALVVAVAIVPVPTTTSRATDSSASERLDALLADRAPAGGTADFATDRDDVARAGLLGPDVAINVANLTVRPGQYIVGYTFEANLSLAGSEAFLQCGVLDSNGRGRYLLLDPDVVVAGTGWQRRSITASFALPDMTLGLRCVPDTVGLGVAEFRDIRLAVVRVPAD